MVEQTSAPLGLVPSDRAAAAAAVLRAALLEGRLPLADLVAIADVLLLAGFRVELPASVIDPWIQGVIVQRRKRCGKPTCHCAAPGAPGHGPYVFRRWRDSNGGRHEEYLGRIRGGDAPARTFPQRARPAAALEPGAPEFDTRFLHDD